MAAPSNSMFKLTKKLKVSASNARQHSAKTTWKGWWSYKMKPELEMLMEGVIADPRNNPWVDSDAEREYWISNNPGANAKSPSSRSSTSITSNNASSPSNKYNNMKSVTESSKDSYGALDNSREYIDEAEQSLLGKYNTTGGMDSMMSKSTSSMMDVFSTGSGGGIPQNPEDRFRYYSWFVQVFFLMMTLFSVICFCAETIQPYDHEYRKEWYILELLFVFTFLFEYSLRVIATSKPKIEFMLEPMNVLDLLSFLPSLLTFVTNSQIMMSELVDWRILRVFRLFRLFKMGRYSSELNHIVNGLFNSRISFLLLAFLMAQALVLFSYLLFLIERGEFDKEKGCYVRRPEEPFYDGCSPFQNVPTTLWWAITTITTVGYGDTFPLNPIGRLIAGFAMVVGILCVALPTTALGVEFAKVYEDARVKREKTTARKQMRELSKDELILIELVKLYGKLKEKLDDHVGPRLHTLLAVLGDPKRDPFEISDGTSENNVSKTLSIASGTSSVGGESNNGNPNGNSSVTPTKMTPRSPRYMRKPTLGSRNSNRITDIAYHPKDPLAHLAFELRAKELSDGMSHYISLMAGNICGGGISASVEVAMYN